MKAALGFIAWYSVTGSVVRTDGNRRVLPVRVIHDQLEAWFEELNLDTSFVPSMLKRIDAWRTATGKRVRWNYEVDGRKAVLTVEEKEVKPDFVTRHIMRTVGDETIHVATLRFIRGGRTSTGKRHQGDHWKATILSGLPAAHRDQVQAFIDHIDEVYKDLSVNLHETKVRGILRDYLVQRLQALPVRAGVYFVHLEHQPELERLQAAVERMGRDCRLEQYPLEDSKRSRQMVLEALEAKVEDQVRLFIDSVNETAETYRTRRQGVPIAKWTEKNLELQEVMNRCEQYSDILGLPQERATKALDAGLAALEELKAQVHRATPKQGGGR